MLTEWTAFGLVFALTTMAALAVFAVLNRGTSDDATSEEPARRMFGPLTPAVAGMVPATAGGQRSVQQDLWLAGYYQPAALGNFYALRSILVVVPLALGLATVLLAPDPRMALYCGIAAAASALLGFVVPRVMLASEAKSRGERLRRGVPMFMDTLGLCLSTGTGLPDSFRRSGDAIVRGYPDLSQDVRIVHRQANLRSMEHALDQWRKRTPLPEVGSLCFLLAQSDRLGTDVSRGLWELSSSYRVNTRQRAEASANRTNFYLLFPTVFCLLMAATIILVGPGFLKMADESQKIVQEVERAKANADDVKTSLQQSATKPPPAVLAPPVSEPLPRN